MAGDRLYLNECRLMQQTKCPVTNAPDRQIFLKMGVGVMQYWCDIEVVFRWY